VARVRDAAAFTDAVYPNDIRLVLDRPSDQQALPVVAPALGPVGDNEIAVGVVGERPELVGEAQVVADEKTAAESLHVDGHVARPRGIALMLLGVREGMHLGVGR